MTDQDKNPALLPSGLADLLPPDAEQEAVAISVLMKTFAKLGYTRVKPPLVEFEDSLFAPGPGAALAGETFRLMDPVSHRMMGVRSDITAQIARIASSRLAKEERPLRLTYASDVLRTKAGDQRTERQFCQVGCENIGDESAEADAEICTLAVQGLKALHVEDITLDLALPRLIDKLFAAFKVDEDEQAAIKEALQRRDIHVLDNLSGDLKSCIEQFLQISQDPEEAIGQLQALKMPKETAGDIDHLHAVLTSVQKALGELDIEGVSISIDVIEQKGFEYHEGLAFTVFAAGLRGELGRGGRYEVRFGEGAPAESATGFTLYMDTVRRAMPAPKAKDIVFVSYGQSWDDVWSLQEEGWTVLRGDKPLARCTHIYKDGKIEKL